ncbi:MJ0042-type zinc finger domain-containing protein [Limnohabitans sp. MMS-10A-178]
MHLCKKCKASFIVLSASAGPQGSSVR